MVPARTARCHHRCHEPGPRWLALLAEMRVGNGRLRSRHGGEWEARAAGPDPGRAARRRRPWPPASRHGPGRARSTATARAPATSGRTGRPADYAPIDRALDAGVYRARIAVTSTSIITPRPVSDGSEIPVVAGPGSVKHAERTRRLAFSSSAVP